MRPKRFGFPFRPVYGSRGMQTTHRCPETGEEVTYLTCEKCQQYGVWAEGDLHRCRHEFEELEEAGFYAKTQEEWEAHIETLDPGTYQRLIEEKRDRERALEELEDERTDAPVAKKQTEEDQEKQDETDKEDEHEPKSGNEDSENEENESDGWW